MLDLAFLLIAFAVLIMRVLPLVLAFLALLRLVPRALLAGLAPLLILLAAHALLVGLGAALVVAAETGALLITLLALLARGSLPLRLFAHAGLLGRVRLAVLIVHFLLVLFGLLLIGLVLLRFVLLFARSTFSLLIVLFLLFHNALLL